MDNFANWLFDPSGLTPHGFCLLWEPGLIWTYAVADVATGAAYVAISFGLVSFIRRRRDLVFRPLFWLFIAFILLCGGTHWFDVLTLWVPAYGILGVAKAATALVSAVAAVSLYLLLPQALALPAPAQLREAVDRLRKSEAFLDRIGSMTGIGGWELDLVTRELSWSAGVYALHGRHPGDLPTLERALESYAPSARPVIKAAVEKATAGGEGWDLELPLIRADGSTIWIRSVGAVEYDGDKPKRLTGALKNITEPRRLLAEATYQARLQAEAAERETALFRNSPDALFVILVESVGDDLAFVYEAFSPAAEKLIGRQAEDVVGRHPGECLPAAAAAGIELNFRRCVQERATITYAATYDLMTGTRDVEGRVTPIEDPVTGEIVRLVGASRDVTERNLLEKSLRHAQKLEAIGTLSAGVAHDFNNILQSIIGGLELVMGDLEPESQASQFAAIAIGSAKRGASLTHHLLAYARKQVLKPQAIDLAMLLTDTHALLARTLGPHIAVKRHVEPLATVLADPGQLQTALLNLAINAAHAMPHGGSLSIDARSDNDQVVIAMTDTGTGMDAATLAQAVEPFFTTKGPVGSGLGLSMVHGFAEQSGGTFTITSKLGEGTTVELRLASAPRVRHPGIPPTTEKRVSSGHILLVDDMADLLMTFGTLLKKAGFSVVQVDRGDKALALLAASERFDAIVTDYAMPGLNGADLITAARLVQPGISSVLMTGYDDVGDSERLPLGTKVLHKPFQFTDLNQTLRSLLEHREAALSNPVLGFAN